MTNLNIIYKVHVHLLIDKPAFDEISFLNAGMTLCVCTIRQNVFLNITFSKISNAECMVYLIHLTCIHWSPHLESVGTYNNDNTWNEKATNKQGQVSKSEIHNNCYNNNNIRISWNGHFTWNRPGNLQRHDWRISGVWRFQARFLSLLDDGICPSRFFVLELPCPQHWWQWLHSHPLAGLDCLTWLCVKFYDTAESTTALDATNPSCPLTTPSSYKRVLMFECFTTIRNRLSSPGGYLGYT